MHLIHPMREAETAGSMGPGGNAKRRRMLASASYCLYRIALRDACGPKQGLSHESGSGKGLPELGS